MLTMLTNDSIVIKATYIAVTNFHLLNYQQVLVLTVSKHVCPVKALEVCSTEDPPLPRSISTPTRSEENWEENGVGNASTKIPDDTSAASS